MGLFGSLSWALAQRILWLGRANNAWGSSRVWNAGSSFETDSATWQGRANTAYDSGVWGSGNTWQADYNAVLPPAAPGDTIVGTASSTVVSGTLLNTQYIVTVDRTGYWYASAFVSATGANSGGDHMDVNIFYNGVSQIGKTFDYTGTRANGGVHMLQPVLISAGQQITLRCQKTSADYTVDATLSELRATFVSTQSNPH
jgi:hypothetical protein